MSDLLESSLSETSGILPGVRLRVKERSPLSSYAVSLGRSSRVLNLQEDAATVSGSAHRPSLGRGSISLMMKGFAGAIFAGGVVGPGLQMLGLTAMPASGASLLLNAEGVFTALLAWFVFRENFDRRIALGMGAIVAGLMILSWPSQAKFTGALPALCILGACFCWAIDNNLTRKVSLNDVNDGLGSIFGIVSGVSGATLGNSHFVLIAGLAGMVASNSSRHSRGSVSTRPRKG